MYLLTHFEAVAREIAAEARGAAAVGGLGDVIGWPRSLLLLALLPALGALAFARPLRPNPILDTQEHA